MEGITISIFGLDRVRRGREGREETSGEEGRPMIDIELIRIIVGGGEDCKGLKINKNGGWESETADGAEPNYCGEKPAYGEKPATVSEA